jgi:hypothetical protein
LSFTAAAGTQNAGGIRLSHPAYDPEACTNRDATLTPPKQQNGSIPSTQNLAGLQNCATESKVGYLKNLHYS